MKYWLIAAVAIILAACNDDIEHKLEGKWQLQQVEADGEVIEADTVFYNFQNVLFMYQVYIPDSSKYVSQYGFNTLGEDNQLMLELAHDPRPADRFLRFTDWKSYKRTFTIEESNRKHLILNSEGKRYTFRKF